MNQVLEKKTGMVQVAKGILLPCDATLNTDKTFNTKLTGTIGEVMYFLRPNWEWNEETGTAKRMLVDETSIEKVIVTRISCATGCATCLHGRKILEKGLGEEYGAVQITFFQERKDAVKAVKAINTYYDTHELKDWAEEFERCVDVKYRYMLQFPVKPQDILLEDNAHYIANRVIAYIYPENAKISYQGHDDVSYEGEKEVHSMHEYSGVRNQYEIVPLIEEKKQETIIDI